MRLLAITAGAGPMYCGSCLRDNALAAELRTRGEDVTLLPLYTPTRTDEPNMSDGRVFFGGISVYLEQHVPLFRKTPWILDRLWDAAPVIRAATSGSVSTDPRKLGALTVSMLKGEAGFQRKEMDKLLHWLSAQPRYDVAVLPNSLLIALAPALKRALHVPVCVTLQGEDLFLEGLPEPWRTEAKALITQQARHVDAFLSVSRYYAAFMAEYLALPRAHMHVVPLGINVTGHEPRRPRPDGPFTLGYLARVAPEKGLHLLAQAYRVLRRERGLPPSRLEAAGYLAPEHRAYLEDVRATLRAAGLEDEFQYRGTLDRDAKIRFLQGLDVFSVPSPYVEPKGLYLLEAMANGVPVVQPQHGAFPELLEATGGGVSFAPGDVGALADAVFALQQDPARAAELGRRGAEAVRRQFSAERMAERALEVYRSAAAGA